MRRLRILQIFSRYIHFGGEESSVSRIGDALQEKHVLVNFMGSTEDLLGDGLASKVALPFRVFHNFQAVVRLRQVQKSGNFDLWQIHNVLPGLSPICISNSF